MEDTKTNFFYCFDVDGKIYRIATNDLKKRGGRLYDRAINDPTANTYAIRISSTQSVFDIITDYIKGYDVMTNSHFLNNEYLVRSVHHDCKTFDIIELIEKLGHIITYNESTTNIVDKSKLLATVKILRFVMNLYGQYLGKYKCHCNLVCDFIESNDEKIVGAINNVQHWRGCTSKQDSIIAELVSYVISNINTVQNESHIQDSLEESKSIPTIINEDSKINNETENDDLFMSQEDLLKELRRTTQQVFTNEPSKLIPNAQITTACGVVITNDDQSRIVNYSQDDDLNCLLKQNITLHSDCHSATSSISPTKSIGTSNTQEFDNAISNETVGSVGALIDFFTSPECKNGVCSNISTRRNSEIKSRPSSPQTTNNLSNAPKQQVRTLPITKINSPNDIPNKSLIEQRSRSNSQRTRTQNDDDDLTKLLVGPPNPEPINNKSKTSESDSESDSDDGDLLEQLRETEVEPEIKSRQHKRKITPNSQYYRNNGFDGWRNSQNTAPVSNVGHNGFRSHSRDSRDSRGSRNASYSRN
jgi:hypothetical protein